MTNKFNDSQEAAICHYKEPALVVAGPGSGKTLVITYRVKNLIENLNVKPEEILVVTFSRAASKEMQERFLRICSTADSRYSGVSFSTFHSFFFRILKLAYNYSAKNIITESQKFAILRDIVSQFNFDYENEADFFSGILSEISLVKNSLIGSDNFKVNGSSSTVGNFETKSNSLETLNFEANNNSSRLFNLETNSSSSETLNFESKSSSLELFNLKTKSNSLKTLNFEAKSIPTEMFSFVFGEYERILRLKNLIDFDDMTSLAYELLSKRDDILKFWQEKFKFILIDEFQDINLLQYETIKLIAGDLKNIFVVGDDDQSIYGFRGSDPAIMKKFLKDFKGAKRIFLNINYRCNEEILKKALQVISVNKNRIDKNIRAFKCNENKSLLRNQAILRNKKIEALKSSRKNIPLSNQPILKNNRISKTIDELVQISGKSNLQTDKFLDKAFSVSEFETQKDEFDFISEMFKMLKNSGADLSETAVLFRSSFDSLKLIDRLVKNNIPFSLKEIPKNLFGHFICKDLIAYMNCAKNLNRKDLLRISNKPLRYISRDAVYSLDKMSLLDYYSEKPYMHDKIIKFGYDLKQLKKLSPYAAVEYIINAIGYKDYLKKYALENRIDYSELYEILNELLESSKPFSYFEEWLEYMDDFSQKLSQDSAEKTDSYGVQIMTMHASKGLEFKRVFIPCLNFEFLPHRRAQTKSEIEEERRLFYVAMTRAKDHLHLSYSNIIRNKRFAPSEFLDNMLL